MTTNSISFGGSVPQAYEEGLCPTVFAPYALDLLERLAPSAGMRILETAAGTGAVTRVLLKGLPADAHLAVTDLNPAMIAVGQPLVGSDPRIEWREADAQALPFDDASFDALVCGFGVMFYPDKPLAMREAKRVLKSGGRMIFNVWDSFDVNAWARVTNEALVELFPADPPPFLKTPFGYFDPAVIRAALTDAGFTDIQIEHVDKEAVCESAELFARGMVLGTPTSAQIQARGTVDPQVVVARVAERLAELGGAAPHRSPIRAVVVSARA